MEHNEYHRSYQEKRRIERLAWAKAYLGGVCVRCGTTEDLQFDHIVPGSRVRTISTATNWSMKRFKEEVDKCQLLCPVCHHQKSREYGEHGGGQNRIDDHGTEAVYAKGCRCEPCRRASYNARVERGELKGTRGHRTREREEAV